MFHVAYAIGVLIADTYWFRTGHPLRVETFDLYTTTAWLIVPLLWECRKLKFDLGWYGLARLKRSDVLLTLGLSLVGALAVWLVPHVEALQQYYANYSGGSSWRWPLLLWCFSWLPGWEFLHRYFVLRAVGRHWWIVVLLETGYHLQKPFLEMAGMFVLSTALTYWTVKRKNALPALLVHLAIELGLIALLTR